MVQTIKVTISGVSPILMHAYPMVPIEALEKKPPEEQAEFAAYRIPTGYPGAGELYIPGVAIQRSFVGGATYSKGKGRGSLQKAAAACLLLDEEYCRLNVKDYVIDSRPVVIPATKGRVMRHRPKVDPWTVSFTLNYDDTLLSAKQVRTIVDDTGRNVGLLDFRPEKKGPFGRFQVNRWEEVRASKNGSDKSTEEPTEEE